MFRVWSYYGWPLRSRSPKGQRSWETGNTFEWLAILLCLILCLSLTCSDAGLDRPIDNSSCVKTGSSMAVSFSSVNGTMSTLNTLPATVNMVWTTSWTLCRQSEHCVWKDKLNTLPATVNICTLSDKANTLPPKWTLCIKRKDEHCLQQWTSLL